jgi:predicted AlkP superfamily pyrophosphatase or phosphodiesterase
MRFFLFLFSLSLFMSCKAQNETANSVLANNVSQNNSNNTKLIVGIVVDQMRYDYLTRFYDKYGKGGFKRMMNEGFNCKNNHLNYVPTHTAPGHATIFTGSTPKYHGIIANRWYDKRADKRVYCAGDDTVNPVGTESSAGQMSPHRMNATTFADENRLFTQMRGKTIGISIKDRGAILPAGHTANAAYWFHGKDEGKFITSSFYMNSLPNWVTNFNTSNTVENYLKTWNTLYDMSTYTESGSDLNNFERGFKGKETATFPYDLKTLSAENGNFDILKSTPYGNNIVADFAIAAIEGEQLGKDNITDVLTISFSSTDYVGHNFGVNSKEIEDTYLRLDKDIERLLNTLDAEVGKNQYTVFLTADHGALNVFAYLQSVKIPSGYLNLSESKDKFNTFMTKTFGASDLVKNVSNNQIFLNHEKLALLGLNLAEAQEIIVNEVINYNYVDKAYSATSLNSNSFSSGIELKIQNGFNQKRSGDVVVVYEPAVIGYYSKTGSSHGAGYNYDTHIPLLFFGNGITHGETLKKTKVIDIAPTISALLGISFPSASIGTPLEFVLD